MVFIIHFYYGKIFLNSGTQQFVFNSIISKDIYFEIKYTYQYTLTVTRHSFTTNTVHIDIQKLMLIVITIKCYFIDYIQSIHVCCIFISLL